MTNLLSPNPSLSGRDLTVDLALKQPTRIRARIANLAASNLLIDKFFRGLGSPVSGGGMLYSVLKATDFFTTDVRQRGAGDEYEIVRGVDPETRLAKPEDWGGKFRITDEQRGRNEISYLDQNTTQLANTIARKLDTRAMEVVQAAVTGDNVVPGHDWGNLTFVGPEANLTPSALRPTADFSAAQLTARAGRHARSAGAAPGPSPRLAGGLRRSARRHARLGGADHVREPARGRR